MEPHDTIAALRWAIAFVRNSYAGGSDYTDEELAVAAEYMRQGQDPWESAAAIQEGRTLSRLEPSS